MDSCRPTRICTTAASSVADLYTSRASLYALLPRCDRFDRTA